MKRICYVFRKKNPIFFSIEKVFYPIIEEIERKGWATQVVEVPNYSSGFISILRNFRLVKNQKADLYHVTGDIHYTVFAFPRKKTILTIHDCVFLYQQKGIKRWLMIQLFLKWPVWYAAKVTTISERSKMDIVRFGKCKPEKVVVIPNPLPKNILPSPYNFNSHCPIILFIGSTPNKNLERVIDALEGINCHLEIVGKVNELIEQRLKKKGIRFQHSYNLNDEQLNEKYSEADLLLFPSLFEGFGLPIIEAQMVGRPVITSNFSPMSEVAGAGAHLIDSYDLASIRAGVLKVISDRDYRRVLVEAGYKNVNRFSIEKISNQYVQIYREFTYLML